MVYAQPKETSEELFRKLDGVDINADATSRCRAAAALGKSGDVTHVPGLIEKGLKEPIPRVQQAIVDALVHLGCENAISGIEQIATGRLVNQTVSVKAKYVAGEMRKASQAPGTRQPRDSSDDVESRILRISGKIGGADSRMLDAIALQSTFQVQRVATEDRPPIVRTIAGLIPDQNSPFLRRQLVQVLSALGGREAQASIEQVAVSDRDKMVRETSRITAATMTIDRTGNHALLAELKRAPALSSVKPAHE